VPPTAPDYPKFLKRIAYVCAGMLIGYVALGALMALKAPRWLVLGTLAAVTIGWIVSTVLVCRSFWREESQRQRGRLPAAVAPRRPRVTATTVVSVIGLPGLVFSGLAALGLPLTIIGAVSHLRWLLIGGLVLLTAELLDLLIVWPARRARIRSTSVND
jgi:hypothetical protein